MDGPPPAVPATGRWSSSAPWWTPCVALSKSRTPWSSATRASAGRGRRERVERTRTFGRLPFRQLPGQEFEDGHCVVPLPPAGFQPLRAAGPAPPLLRLPVSPAAPLPLVRSQPLRPRAVPRLTAAPQPGQRAAPPPPFGLSRRLAISPAPGAPRVRPQPLRAGEAPLRATRARGSISRRRNRSGCGKSQFLADGSASSCQLAGPRAAAWARRRRARE